MDAKEIIEWYISDGVRSSDIEMIIERKGMLAGHGWHLSAKCVTMHNLHLEATFNRKQFSAEAYAVCRKEKVTIKDSENMVVIQAQRFYETEISTECNYRHFKGQVEQLNKLVDAMTQQISHLRKEKDSAQFMGQRN